MRRDGLDNVRAEPVMVPKWVRGRESAEIVHPPLHSLAVLGLGGSNGTPPGGIEADVITVASFDELRSRAADVKGRIVLLNAPFTTYSDTVTYRTNGARLASQLGAVATLVRGVGPTGLRTPHTGSVQYRHGRRTDSSSINRRRRRRSYCASQRARSRPHQAHHGGAHRAGRRIGQCRRRNPRTRAAGRDCAARGHLDSWDVGTGASDDAVGCIVTWEAARLMSKLKIRPRRTVRIVLWTNEENGLRGATAYAAKHAAHAS